MRILFISLSFLCISISTSAQTILPKSLSRDYQKADSLYKIRNYKDAIPVLDLIVKRKKSNTLEQAYSFNLIGLCYDRMNMFDSAIHYFNKAEPLARQLKDNGPLTNLLLFRAYAEQSLMFLKESNRDLEEHISIMESDPSPNHYKLAFAYKALVENRFKLKKLDSTQALVEKMNTHARLDTTQKVVIHAANTTAWYYYEIGDLHRALNIWEDQTKKDAIDASPSTLSNFQNIATTYFELGDFKRAEQYYRTVEQAYRANNDTQSFGFYRLMSALGHTYNKLNQPALALTKLNEGLSVLKNLHYSDDNPQVIVLLNKKANALAGLGDFEGAINLISKNIAIQEKLKAEKAQLVQSYTLRGLIYFDKENYKLALADFNKSLNNHKKLSSTSPMDLSLDYRNISSCYTRLEKYDKALQYLDSAMFKVRRDHLSDGENFENLISENHQIIIYCDKLYILQQQFKGDRKNEYLKEAKNTILACDRLIDFARKTVVNDYSRINLAKNFYDLSIYFYYQDYLTNKSDLIEVLTFVDKDKSYILNELNALSMGLNQSLNNNDLIHARNEIQGKIHLYKSLENQKEVVAQYNKLDSINYLINTSLQRNSFNEFRSIDAQQLHKALGDNTTFISYHIDKDDLYIFYGDGKNINVELSHLDSDIHQKIETLRNKLISRQDLDEEINYLSKKLIPAKLSTTKQRLVIIPDGGLGYIPFEILEKDDQYLIENYTVSYDFSLTNMMAQKNKKGHVENENDLLAMAPSFGNDLDGNLLAKNDVVRSTISPLPGAKIEIEKISEIFKGEGILDAMATESYFKNNADLFRILHLATHAIVDDENPESAKLIFNLKNDSIEDGYLYAHEIYGMKLNAELVVLSACNTGFGKIQEGEGVMSLGRAFANSGCPAVLMSLWPASDKSTPEVMNSFYKYLKDGHDKDEAIRLAKLEYLKTAKNEGRHPYYWAGFTLNGDVQPIVKTTPWYYYLMASGVILLLLVVAGSYYKSSRSKVASD